MPTQASMYACTAWYNFAKVYSYKCSAAAVLVSEMRESVLFYSQDRLYGKGKPRVDDLIVGRCA